MENLISELWTGWNEKFLILFRVLVGSSRDTYLSHLLKHGHWLKYNYWECHQGRDIRTNILMQHFPHAFPLLHINKKGQKTSLDLKRFQIRYGVINSWTNCFCWSDSIEHKDGKHLVFQLYEHINNQNHETVAESFLFVMARSKTNQQELESKYLTSSLNLPLAASSSTFPWPPSGTTSKCSCPSKLQKIIRSKNKPFYISWSVQKVS